MAKKPDIRKKPGPTERARLKAAKEAETKRLAAEAEAAAAKKAKPSIPKRPAKSSAAQIGEALVKERAAKAAPIVDEDDDEEVPVAKPKEPKVKTKPAVLDPNKTMGKSYQRNGMIAEGFVIKGGGIQLTVTVLKSQRDELVRLAATNGVSLSEQLRRTLLAADVGRAGA